MITSYLYRMILCTFNVSSCVLLFASCVYTNTNDNIIILVFSDKFFEMLLYRITYNCIRLMAIVKYRCDSGTKHNKW